MEVLAKLKELVIQGKDTEATELLKNLLEQNLAVEQILNEALIPAMDEVGELFQKGEYFIPEMLVSARAMQKCMEVIRPKLQEKGVKAQ